jgi:hypothetical protein
VKNGKPSIRLVLQCAIDLLAVGGGAAFVTLLP